PFQMQGFLEPSSVQQSLISLQNNKATIGFTHLWHWAEQAGEVYRRKIAIPDSSKLHDPLLDINPEGRLQQEIKDVIDELTIMIQINEKQRDILKRFARNVEHVLDPDGLFRELVLPSQDERAT